MDHGSSHSLRVTLLALACFIPLAACKSVPPAEPPVTHAPSFDSSQPAERVEESERFQEAMPSGETVTESPSSLAEKLNARGVLGNIHYEFDRYNLLPEAIRTLGENAGAIKQNQQFAVRVEGHCDERGTIEYNLALGEKRAREARDYLVSIGIPARRLRIISYGKERPRNPGHNETAWGENRRSEFIFLAE